jgi:SAM-dependent methyltransferase
MATLQQITYQFDTYIQKCRATAYSEEQSQLHTFIAQQAWRNVKGLINTPPGGKIADLGCGSGFCLDMFKADGYDPLGITCMEEEFRSIASRDLRAVIGDIHDIGAFDNYFHGVWCRHAAEHSPAPGFLLTQIFQSMKPNGWLYLEVPAPGTACKHEENPNHYSVMGADMWMQLIKRAGFLPLDHTRICFKVEAGEDEYYNWIARKPAES